MKKTRYTEKQIAFALKVETRPRVGEVCRKMGFLTPSEFKAGRRNRKFKGKQTEMTK